MKILIDGYNLSLNKGTGISTYARNLSFSSRNIGAEVSILYGNGKAISKDPLLNEILFFDPAENIQFRHEKQSIKLRKIKRFIFTLFGRTVADEIKISGHVVFEQFKKNLPYFDKIYNCPDIYWVAIAYFYLTGKFLNLILPDKIDVAHWTYPVPLKINGAKNIYTLHDLVPLKLPYTTLDDKEFYYKLVKSITKTADKIVTVSEFSKNDIVEMLNVPENFVVNTYQSVALPKAYSNVSEPELTLVLKNHFGLNHKRFILFVGAIEPKKNITRLLEAYLGTDIKMPLVMVGPVAWMSDKELSILNQLEMTTKRDKRRVKRLDYVPLSMLVYLIKGAKFLAFPSLYEGFGLPVLESMILGTPVLTSNTSCIPEISGDAAYLIDPYDVQSIRRGMLELSSNDTLCSKLSALGMEQSEKFSSRIYEERLKKLYSDLCLNGQR